MAMPLSRTLARRGGQSATEQVLLIAAVVGALVGMQLYIRRAVQGRIHASRATMLGRETPFYYYDGGEPSRTREYHLNIRETVTSAPTRVTNMTDPLRGLAENRMMTHFTATTTFNERTVVQ